MSIHLRRFLFALPIFVAFTVGCGPKSLTPAKVTGTVRYKGQLIKGGGIQFIAKDGSLGGGAVITDDGTYSTDLPVGELDVAIETESVNPDAKTPNYGGPNAPPGAGMGPSGAMKMKMAASKPQPGKEQAKSKQMAAYSGMAPPPSEEEVKAKYVKIPAKYAKTTTSGLSVTTKTGAQSLDFDLTD